MTDTNLSGQINIGQDARGIIGQTITNATYVEHQQVITPDAIVHRELVRRSPYKALKRFDVDDSEYFFGRYRLILELQDAIQNSNLILVLGASGSGKSSVVRAKIIPAFLETSSHQHNFVLTPKDNPFQSLYDSLIGRDKVGSDKDYCFSESEAQFILEGKPNGKPNILTQVVHKLKEEKSKWIIFIDQFEELFTRCTNLKQRENFINSITQIAEAEDHSVKIVLAMRADFLEQFSPYPRFGQWVQRQIHLVTNMPEDELELAIKGPAAKHGVQFEPGLAKEIIEDVQGQAGSLPLMQYTLDRLWKYEVEKDGLADRTLNTSNYRDLGKIRGTLEKHVNEIYADLSPTGQQAAKRIFLNLVKLVKTDGVVKPVSQGIPRSVLQGEAVQETIDRLINENLLVSSSKNLGQAALQVQDGMKQQQATIEIAHEILLSSWKLLSDWIEEAKNILMIKSRLVEDLGRWNDQKQANQELLKGSFLEKVLESKKENLFELQSVPLSAEEEKYIAASQQFQQRELKRARRIAIGASIGAVVMAGAAIFSAIQVRQSEIQQILALLSSSEAKLGAGAGLDAVMDSLRAGRTLKRSFWQLVLPQAGLHESVMDGLSKTLYAAQEDNRLDNHDNGISSVMFSPDGKTIAVWNNKTVKLWNLEGKLLHTIQHNDRIIDVVFSPDGKTIASASFDSTVKLWNIEGQLLHTLQHSAVVDSVVFSPDGKTIASGSRDHTVKLWNLEGQLLHTLQHNDFSIRVVFSPDSRIIAGFGDNTVKLWNLEGQLLHTLQHSDSVSSVVFSPGGKTIASASDDATVKLWNLKGQLLHTLQHNDGITSVAFSPNSRTIASASRDGTVTLWGLEGEQWLTLKHGTQANSGWFSVMFSPDGKTIATSVSDEKTVKLWNLEGQELHTLQHSDSVNSIVFSPDGKTIASASYDGAVKLWNLEGPELHTLQHSDMVLSVMFSPDGKTIASGSRDHTVKLWNLEGQELHTLQQSYMVDSVMFSPDGKTIASGSHDGTVKLWNLKGQELHTLQQGDGFISTRLLQLGIGLSMVFSPDGKTIAVNSDKTVKLWNLEGRELQTLQHSDLVSSVVFSPDSKTIAVSGDKTVKLWNLKGQELQTLQHDVWVNSVVFSPDGKTIASASDNTVTLWNLEGQKLHTLKHSNRVNSVVFSPDSKTIAVNSDKTVKLWNLEGRELQTLQNSDLVYSVAFSPDGKTIASGSRDGTVKLWNLKGQALHSLKHSNSDSVNSIVFSPDGKTIASASYDGTVKLWSVEGFDETLARGCNWVRNYLANNPNAERDRHLCDGISATKPDESSYSS